MQAAPVPVAYFIMLTPTVSNFGCARHADASGVVNASMLAVSSLQPLIASVFLQTPRLPWLVRFFEWRLFGGPAQPGRPHPCAFGRAQQAAAALYAAGAQPSVAFEGLAEIAKCEGRKVESWMRPTTKDKRVASGVADSAWT